MLKITIQVIALEGSSALILVLVSISGAKRPSGHGLFQPGDILLDPIQQKKILAVDPNMLLRAYGLVALRPFNLLRVAYMPSAIPWPWGNTRSSPAFASGSRWPLKFRERLLTDIPDISDLHLNLLDL